MKIVSKKSRISASPASSFSLYTLILVIALMFFTFGGFVVGYVSGAMNQRAVARAGLVPDAQGGIRTMNPPALPQ